MGLLIFLFLAGRAAAADFSETKSNHFIVYHKDVPEDFVQTVIQQAERYYEELTEKLGFRRYNYWTWDNRARIYIYPDQEAFTKETHQPAWAGGVASYEEKTIWTFPRESGFFDTLLPHEIGHIVFREVVGGRQRIPLWLEEGVASYLEQARRFGADRAVLKAMASKRFIPLDELDRIDVSALKMRLDVELFYAESVSLVSFLLQKFGTDKFNYLCQKLKDGQSLEDALSYAYFNIRNLSDLGKAWEDSLRQKQGRGGRTSF